MKKLMMGLAAILATSFAVPAFAGDAPAAGDAPKKEKKSKGKKAPAKDAAPKAPEGGGAK